MNSKERVLRAVHRQQPDRVPVGYAGANGDIDRRLKARFGLAPDDHEGLLQALQVDTRMVNPVYCGPRLHAEAPGRQVDPLWGVRTRWIEHESGGYWDFCDFPLREATLEEVEAWPMPDPDDFDYAAFAAECVARQDYAVIVGNPGLGDIINSSGMLRTMEQVLIDLVTDDPAGVRLFQRKCAVQAEMLARALDAARGAVDMVWIGEDLGTQQGPIISLDLFRRHIRPHMQRFVDIARGHDLPVMIHCCGSSSWAFDDFVEIGIGVVDTLQPEAARMAPAWLKDHYGNRLSFHGCISTAGPMAYGTVAETVANVRDTLEIMKPGGGYLLAPTHMIQDNSPTENVVAAFEAARAYGTY